MLPERGTGLNRLSNTLSLKHYYTYYWVSEFAMKHISKIKLENFKRFRSFRVLLYNDLNVIVGENESGKSTILSAINYVLSGNRNKIEGIGFDKLINTQAVKEFLASDKNYKDLPKLTVELYLNEQNNIDLNGKNNSETKGSVYLIYESRSLSTCSAVNNNW